MPRTIKLSSVIDQQEAQKLHLSILECIDEVEGLEIDASIVERIGTSGIEVLIATDSYFKDKGSVLRIKAWSGAFEAAFVDLGFVNLVQEWKVR